ncbi:MAG: insulinase family protein [Candidatus Pacebacteria bacterium]|nr:insulinase family protein [Candidatus Paceibacterota bacterium]
MYKKTTLANGTRIILAPMKSTKTVTVLVIIGTGSKNETAKNRGISHFLEHMFFKGTQKRPTKLEIAKELDSVGGSYNAFTGKEHTGFWAKVDSKHCDLALDVISDMLLDSKLTNEDIDSERGTVIEELNMFFDNPIMRIPFLFEEVLYPNNSMGWDIGGTKETVGAMSRKDFVNYYKKYYTADNCVIAVAGNFDEKNIKKKIKKYFDSINETKAKKQIKVSGKQNEVEILIDYKKTDQSHLCLGVRGYKSDHKDKAVLSVLSVILGGNMSSRLYMSVVEKGLAYYIQTSSDNYRETGYLATQTGVNNKKCFDAIKLVIEEYKKIKNEKVSIAELQRAKDYIKGQTIIALESSNSVANFLAIQEMDNNKILTTEEKFARIDAVTPEDVQRVANKIFVEKGLNLAIIGPFKSKKSFEKILKL